MNKIYSLLVIVILAIVGIKYSFGIVDIIILLFNCIGTVLFLNKCRTLKANLFQITYFIAIFFSTIFFSAFTLFPERNQPTDSILFEFSRFGNECLAVFFLSWLLIGNIVSKKKGKVRPNTPQVYYPLNKLLVWSIIIFMYLLTAFSAVIGLGVMGKEAVQLPFGLGGLIVGLRHDVAPILFMLFIHNALATKRIRKDKTIIAACIIWAVFETLAVLSKSSFLAFFIPTAIMIFYSGYVSNKKMVRIALPIIIVFILGYTTIENLRSFDTSNTKSLSSAYDAGNLHDDAMVTRVLNRVFTTPVNYVVCIPLINDRELFDFSRSLYVAAVGGSAKYRTFVIEGYKEDAHHSSGTSSLMDAYLLGGKGFVYVTILLITLFVILSDRKASDLYKPMLFNIATSLTLFISWSLLLDGETVFHIGVWFLQWWLIHQYGKKYIKVVKTK